MASSRESSVDAGYIPVSPSQLTPRSKVKAMLASLEDSDDEVPSRSTTTKLVQASSQDAQLIRDEQGSPLILANISRAEDNSKDVLNDSKEVATSSDDSDDDIVQPKGRMAARMQTVENETQNFEKVADTARDRVRKLLQSTDPAQSNSHTHDEEVNGGDNEEVSKRPRKLTRRRHTGSLSPRVRSRTSSPGLFVSPTKSRAISSQDGSDSDELPSNPATDNRFKALVEKKRQERLAKEAEVAKQRAEREAALRKQRKEQDSLAEEDVDMDDDGIEKRLTQQAPPTRKASKKALEEMHREAQRLSRNMQLTHEARTKKKITKDSLFARFNYKPAGVREDPVVDPVGTASSSQKSQSETEHADTPPTSPPLEEEYHKSSEIDQSLSANNLLESNIDEDLPPLNEVIAMTKAPKEVGKIDKGKGKEPMGEQQHQREELQKKQSLSKRHIQIPSLKTSHKASPAGDDSDSELEIVTSKSSPRKKRLDTIFDRVPLHQAKEPHSLQALRALAHLGSPSKKRSKKHANDSMSTTELQVLLQQRAREQAVREREERLQALRAKGIIIQTAEEREQELADLEDLVAKARREAEEIMKKEKAAAKGEQNGNGQSSSDEDWDGSESDFSGSGSDKVSGNDENSEDEMSVDEDEKSAPVHPMFDEEASENEEGESRLSNEVDIYDRERMEEDDDEELNLPANHVSRRKQNTRVLSDDEGETDANQSQPTPNTKSPVQLHSESPMPPNSVLRSASKTFIPGLTVAGPAGLGLTQIFAGTMDESQNDPFDGSPSIKRSTAQVADTEKNSMAFLQKLRAPDLPPFNPTMEDDSQDVVMDSQTAINQDPESQPPESDSQNIQLQFSQSQIQGFDSLVQDPMATQSFETLGSTQDAGFQQMTPIKGRFVEPPSTIDTVLIEPTPSHRNMAESEVSKKRGKLRRRTRVASISDEESVYAATSKEDENVESEITASIFDVMRKAAKKTVVNDDFNKKTSKAREIIDEQAEESEDEYAGLGGASEDESGSEDEYVKEMIDDDAGKEADEHQLAAFYADRERANDEKQIEKLYNDITKGMLRRKRGADYDLSDSDDDGEARRRMKRKEFARMRKALLADERIGKIAEDPKKQAFLRAIEDRPSDDEMDFLDDFVEQDDKDSESQSQGTDSEQHTESRMATLQKRKHQDGLRESGVRPPPHLRRTNPSKRPSNLAEIRQSLSSIIEEPNATTVTTEVDSDSEDDLEVEGDDKETEGLSKEKENRGPLAIRRANKPIIDRISLKRASSNASSSSGRLAFAAPSVSSGFKVPALLRRATTNSSIASVSSTSSGVSTGMSSTERTAGGASNDNIKRGGGKKSGVNFFVRESERRAALVKTEKRREQKIFKGAEVRRKAVGGILGSGKFE